MQKLAIVIRIEMSIVMYVFYTCYQLANEEISGASPSNNEAYILYYLFIFYYIFDVTDMLRYVFEENWVKYYLKAIKKFRFTGVRTTCSSKARHKPKWLP